MDSFGNTDLTLERERSLPPIYKHVAKTYAWMFLGLAITFAVGQLLNVTGMVYAIFLFRALPIVLLVGELALVWFLTSRLGTQSVAATRALFVVYSALSGVTFSAVLAIYGVGQALVFCGLAAVF